MSACEIGLVLFGCRESEVRDIVENVLKSVYHTCGGDINPQQGIQ